MITLTEQLKLYSCYYLERPAICNRQTRNEKVSLKVVPSVELVFAESYLYPFLPESRYLSNIQVCFILIYVILWIL